MIGFYIAWRKNSSCRANSTVSRNEHKARCTGYSRLATLNELLDNKGEGTAGVDRTGKDSVYKEGLLEEWTLVLDGMFNEVETL